MEIVIAKRFPDDFSQMYLWRQATTSYMLRKLSDHSCMDPILLGVLSNVPSASYSAPSLDLPRYSDGPIFDHIAPVPLR